VTKRSEDKNPALRVVGIALWLLVGLGLMAWIIRVAVASDYYEPGVLALGVASFFCLLAARWRASVILRALFCVCLLVFIGAAGIGLENLGRYRQRSGTVIARAMLVHIGDSLKHLSERAGDVPDCAFPCMAESLIKSGEFKGFKLYYDDGSEGAAFTEIPNRDPWNCRWFYKKIGREAFVLRSSGPDRRFNTVDDITVVSAISESNPIKTLPRWDGWFAKRREKVPGSNPIDRSKTRP
jgi:hypothetical protein